jgi:hypothetical protein
VYNTHEESRLFSHIEGAINNMKSVIIFLIAGIFSYAFCQEEAEEKSQSETPAIKLSGFGYYMFGQIESGTYGDDFTQGSRFNHLWVNTSLMHLNATSDATDWLTAKLGFEMYADFPLKGSSAMDKSSYFRSYKAYLASAEGIMHWKYADNILSSLRVESGLFPYTINPDVKTLGNYLFRSTIHPISVQNKVDYPWADLLGVNAEAGLLEDKLKLNAILSSEFIYVPFFDFTPAFAVSYAPNKMIDIGGAIAFHHAFQADNALLPDSIGKKWQGTKINARATLDPKPLLGEPDCMGKDEFKIYAEIAVLGLKDSVEVDTTGSNGVFPANSLMHHMPFMIGFNVPTFKILDCFAIELEWFNSPYANDWFGLYAQQSSSARPPTTPEQWTNYISDDNFKWSIYLNKVIGKFEVRSIIGSDHTVYRLLNQSTGNFEQTMKRKGDWQWMLELRYNL